MSFLKREITLPPSMVCTDADWKRAEQLQSVTGTCRSGRSRSGLGPGRAYYVEGKYALWHLEPFPINRTQLKTWRRTGMKMCSPLWTNLVPCCTDSFREKSSVLARMCNWFYWSSLTLRGWVGWQILLYCQRGQNRPLDFNGNVLLPNDSRAISNTSINVSLLLKKPLRERIDLTDISSLFPPFTNITKKVSYFGLTLWYCVPQPL